MLPTDRTQSTEKWLSVVTFGSTGL